MKQDGIIQRLKPVFDRVSQQISEHLVTDVPFVEQVARHILESGGKHLRPTLFVLSTQLCEYTGNKDYFLSSVFEYLHAATLLHDDVIDQSDTRRGKPAAHTVYGNPGVILVGDFLLAKSMSLGAQSEMLNFTEVMSETVSRMAEGEVLQLIHARDPNITEKEYEEVIYRKTAALFESACYLGAVLASAPDVQAQALKRFGQKVGLAFQVIDDCLDYTGTSSEFGKPVGHDLEEGKITLPLIRTLKQATEAERNELIALIKQDTRTPEEFAGLKATVDLYRGLEQAMERAREFTEEAIGSLDVFPDNHKKEALSDLAHFLITRRK